MSTEQPTQTTTIDQSEHKDDKNGKDLYIEVEEDIWPSVREIMGKKC